MVKVYYFLYNIKLVCIFRVNYMFPNIYIYSIELLSLITSADTFIFLTCKNTMIVGGKTAHPEKSTIQG